MIAAVAIDQYPAHAHFAHLAKCDFHLPAVGVRRRVARSSRHTTIETRRGRESNCRLLVAPKVRKLQPVVYQAVGFFMDL